MDCHALNIVTEPSANMSKIEITLRLEKEQMAAIIARLLAERPRWPIAITHDDKYGEQCDETQEEPPSKLAAFPARALRHQIQRIGLFTL